MIERKITAALQVDTAHVHLPKDLRDRIKRRAAEPQRRRPWTRLAVAGLVASLFAPVSLPGVRAAATNVIRQVFRIGSAEYIVNSGSDPAPQAELAEVQELDPEPDSENRWFYAPSGFLPAKGIHAVKGLRAEFRLPAWLPGDEPKRLQLPLESYNGDPFYSLATLSNRHSVMVTARSPMVGFREFVGTAKIDAKPVLLGGIEALEVQLGNETSYYLSMDNVSYRVFGPTTEKEVVKKIAESLTPQTH